MKVLLINPPSAGVFAAFGLALPPLGLLYLASALERAGHQVTVKDLQVQKLAPKELLHADVVGITSDTTRIEEALKIARRACSLGKRVVMGGPHPQFMAGELLGSGVHYIVKGEGEETLPKLLAALDRQGDAGEIPGLIYQEGDTMVETPCAEPPDLEALPLPARHLLDLGSYSATLFGRPLTPIVTSRGCPGCCSFCSSSRFFGSGWRSRSAESVLTEIEEIYHRYGFRAVAFVDDNFTQSPQRVIDIAEGIRQRGLDLKWWNFSRVDTIVRNPEMVEAMARAGSAMVYLGVETTNRETLKTFGKAGKADEAAEAVRMLRQAGIEVFASYILGGLGETRRDVIATIEGAVRLDSNIAQFSVLTPYPGTELYDRLQDRLVTRRWKRYDGLHALFRHPRMSRHTLQLLLIWAYFRFYRRSQTARQNFKAAGKRQMVAVGKIFACIRELIF